MRIYTKSGDLAFSTFTFPDGQPHFKLETYEREFREVTIETAIKTPDDLFLVLLASSVLRQQGYQQINLDIRYLLAARMDRSIDSLQPFTLAVVAGLLNGAGFSKVRILDVHSEVATRLIRNSENVLPFKVVEQVMSTLGNVIPVASDKGAELRVARLVDIYFIQCHKIRDPQTGVLSGFAVPSEFEGCIYKDVLIVDDICDGGGTFVGLAKELRKAGAKKVFLFVTHGIFSKGLPLEGIDKVFTTDSYTDKHAYENLIAGLTVIPISMKELK